MDKTNDPRFNDMYSAPIFKKQKRDKFKVKVDDRFKGVITDDRFRVTGTGGVDLYGRKKSKSKTSAQDELKEFYEIEDENTSSIPATKTPKKSGDAESRLDYLNKLARGEISGSSSSDSDSESESDDDDNDSSNESSSSDVDSEMGDDPLAVPGDHIEYADDNDGSAEQIEDSCRLAIQNCEWEKVTAEDLLMILQSFCPSGGIVRSVTVYPSDFGLEQLEHENMYGPPKSIWKSKAQDVDEDSDEIDVDEEDDESDDENEADSSDDVDSEDEVHDIKEMEKPSTRVKGADFIRSKPGLVLDLEADSDEDDDEESGTFNSGAADVSVTKKDGKKNASSDIDAVALRAYELSKLRYYFAIAELSDSRVANHVYKELDGMELEHSSMAMDLRFVPSDVSFKSRKVRDACSKPSALYKPPNDFVVNALQRTNVNCTWETEDAFGGAIEGNGKRGGGKGATTASQWRELAESDMQQYLANSSSEDEVNAEDSGSSQGGSSDDSGDDSDDRAGRKKPKKKLSKKAAKLRQLLLGGGESDGEKDDFFLDDDMSDGGMADCMRDGDEDEGEVDKVFTFVPDADSEDDKKALAKRIATESPAEALKRKRDAKKKAKRATSAETDNNVEEDINLDNYDEVMTKKEKSAGKGKKKNKSGIVREEVLDEDEKRRLQDLELMFAGEDGAGAGTDRLRYSKKEFEKAAKNKDTKKKNKKHRMTDDAGEDNFKLDLADSRFGAVLDGSNPNFGIDPLSNEYRPTEAMKLILKEQQTRRNSTKDKKRVNDMADEDRGESGGDGVNISDLVSKLKAKSSGDVNRKRLRGAR